MRSTSSIRHRALIGCFLAGGVGLGTWGANLPALGRRADISEAELGLVLLCFASGAIFAMINAPRVIRLIGAGRLAAIAALLWGVVIMSVSLGQSMASASIIAILGGIVFGALDVAMNREVASMEAETAKPMMASFHAIFSLGTLISALLYAGLIKVGLGAAACLVVAGGLIAAISMVSIAGLPVKPQSLPPAGTIATTAIPSMRVFVLGAMAFLAFFAEGAILDWIAVYMVRSIGTGESTGAFCYAVFAGAMTVGRIFGDRATVIFGPVTLFYAGTISVALSLALALSTTSIPVIFFALAVSGLGTANIIPIIFSETGRLSDSDGGKSMSRVLTMGYAGILIGPALIGFAAEIATLKVALFAVVAAMILISFSGRHLGKQRI